MSLKTVEGIERALVTLTPHQLGELYAWFDPYRHPLDARIKSDLASGGSTSSCRVLCPMSGTVGPGHSRVMNHRATSGFGRHTEISGLTFNCV